jgi:hypothetical protein
VLDLDKRKVTLYGKTVRGSGPIILHWDGQAWTSITHPRAFPNSAILRAVTTASGGRAWSVGYRVEVTPDGLTIQERTLVHSYVP